MVVGGQRFLNHTATCFQAFAIQGVVRPASLLPVCDEAGLAEDAEMMGQERLRHINLGHQVTDALLAASHNIEDAEARCVAQGLERQRRGLRS